MKSNSLAVRRCCYTSNNSWSVPPNMMAMKLTFWQYEQRQRLAVQKQGDTEHGQKQHGQKQWVALTCVAHEVNNTQALEELCCHICQLCIVISLDSSGARQSFLQLLQVCQCVHQIQTDCLKRPRPWSVPASNRTGMKGAMASYNAKVHDDRATSVTYPNNTNCWQKQTETFRNVQA